MLGLRPLKSYLMDANSSFHLTMILLRVLPWLPTMERLVGDGRRAGSAAAEGAGGRKNE